MSTILFPANLLRAAVFASRLLLLPGTPERHVGGSAFGGRSLAAERGAVGTDQVALGRERSGPVSPSPAQLLHHILFVRSLAHPLDLRPGAQPCGHAGDNPHVTFRHLEFIPLDDLDPVAGMGACLHAGCHFPLKAQLSHAHPHCRPHVELEIHVALHVTPQ